MPKNKLNKRAKKIQINRIPLNRRSHVIDLSKIHPSKRDVVIDKLLKFVKKHPFAIILILPP